MTSQKLKEHGTYIGFNKDYGYLYMVAESIYAYNKNGIEKVFLKIV